jgi:hypothetical protein
MFKQSLTKRLAGALMGFVRPDYSEPGYVATARWKPGFRHMVQFDSSAGYKEAGIPDRDAKMWCGEDMPFNPTNIVWMPHSFVSCKGCLEGFAKALLDRAEQQRILNAY